MRIKNRNMIKTGMFGGAAAPTLMDNLIGWWPMNEASGNALDAHTNALHMTALNAPGADTGKVYPTARTYVTASVQAHYDNSASALFRCWQDMDYTWAAWFKLSANAPQPIVCRQRTGTGLADSDYTLYWKSDSSALRILVGDNNTHLSLAEVALTYNTNWHFVIAQRQSTTKLRISLDGGAFTEAAITGMTVTNDNTSIKTTFAAKNATGSSPASAVIGPVGFWRSLPGAGGVLSDTLCAQLWNGGVGLAYPF